MPVKMFGVMLWVVLLSASVSGVIGRWNDDQTQSCDEEIKEMLHILTNEVAELKKEVQEMNRGRNPEEQKTKENEKNTGGELKILSVNRKALVGREVQFTVQYKVPSNSLFPTYVLWEEPQDRTFTIIPETVSNDIPNLPPGVFETSITATARTNSDSGIMVEIGNYHEQFLTVTLANNDVNDLSETDIETPLLDIIPKGDIVYEPGHNATVTVIHPLQKSSLNAGFALTKPGVREIITRSNEEGNIIHLDNKRKYVDKIESNFVIQTEDTSYSGIIQISYFDSKETGLVRRIEHYKMAFLRPSTQKRAFPEGEIYASEMYGLERNQKGEMFCAYGKTCKTHCKFYGNDLSNLELFKTVNGNTTREHIELYNVWQMTNYKHGLFEVSETESDPSPVVYTCRASNTKGQTLDTNTVVTFGYGVKILVNESSMEMLDDTTAKLVCTVRGQPVANVTIECNGVPAGDSEVVFQSHDEIQVAAICPYFQGSWFTCTAENGFQTKYYYFRVLEEVGNSTSYIEYV